MELWWAGLLVVAVARFVSRQMRTVIEAGAIIGRRISKLYVCVAVEMATGVCVENLVQIVDKCRGESS